MVKGFPDWTSPAGRVVGGETIDSTSSSAEIASGATGDIDITVIPTGEEHFYQGFIIAVSDDSFIHNVKLMRVSDLFIWWEQDFVTAGSWEVPGFRFPAGEQLRIRIINNGDATLTFIAIIFTTKRNI